MSAFTEYVPGISSKLDTAYDILSTFGVALLPCPEDMPQSYIYDGASLSVSGDDVRVEVNFYTSSSWEYADAESLRRLKEFRRMIPGTWEKKYYGSTMSFRRTINGVRISLNTSRAATCRRVVIGTEEVPEQIIPASTREKVEWVCDD